MKYERLRQEVLEGNLLLPKYGLVVMIWGNASSIDREKGVIGIKPSGVRYEYMTKGDIVICDLEGNVIEGDLRPSSDLMTHVEIYKHFPEIRGVVHTHSKWATSWAQTGRDLVPIGTTHADHFYGSVPCTREMTHEEIDGDYEGETGKVIVETFKNRRINPLHVPGVLVNSHGPFTFGRNINEAVSNSLVLEECVMMAYITGQITGVTREMDRHLLDKHFERKYGENAYYGQI